jgi:hypothetical protein
MKPILEVQIQIDIETKKFLTPKDETEKIKSQFGEQ